MRIQRGFIIGAVIVLGAVFAAPAAVATVPVLTYSTYDVPGSVSTVVSGVNDLGVIAGYYADVSGQHGFIDTDGTVVSLDGPIGSTGYVVTSINIAGTITGAYWIGTTEHGFMRSATGETTVLDYPKVGIASRQGTFASQINNDGVIVGYYFTARDNAYTYPNGTTKGASTTYHGFVWKDGKFTTYDAPGARTPPNGTEPAYGTQLLGLNNVGDMVGTYTRPASTPINAGFEISGVTFTRNNAAVTSGRSVTFTPIVEPWVPTNWCGSTTPTAINDSGVIVGNSANGCAPVYAVWESTGGVLTDVYASPDPSSGATSFLVLVANSINNNALIGGTWYTWTPNPEPDAGPVNGPNHGFTGNVG